MRERVWSSSKQVTSDNDKISQAATSNSKNQLFNVFGKISNNKNINDSHKYSAKWDSVHGTYRYVYACVYVCDLSAWAFLI